MAHLIEVTGAESWSEHLAFVRGGDIEIGHLAAPPRSEASIEELPNLGLRRTDCRLRAARRKHRHLVAPPASSAGRGRVDRTHRLRSRRRAIARSP